MSWVLHNDKQGWRVRYKKIPPNANTCLRKQIRALRHSIKECLTVMNQAETERILRSAEIRVHDLLGVHSWLIKYIKNQK